MINGDTTPDKPEINLRLHYDMNGSWLEVPLTMLWLLDMPPKVFSQYSYIDDSAIYLEEDLDAGKFLARFKHLYTQAPKVLAIDHGEDASTIREKSKNAEGRDVILH